MARKQIIFTEGWKFHLGDSSGAEMESFDDSGWRLLDLPHDWSVEHSFNSDLEGATGYLPGGIGWYRKTFSKPEGDVVYLHFDGVYNNASFYLNGKKLGDHPYGYSPFHYEISEQLTAGNNVLAVRVDHSRYCDSRWYTGSGIYRPVELISVAATHIPLWGTFVTTPVVSAEKALVQIETEVACPEGATVTTKIMDPDGNEITAQSIDADARVLQSMEVSSPRLWDLDTPHLYEAVTTVSKGEKEIDQSRTTFGIRSLRFDADEGFFLNGRHTLIKGVCLHHDGGCVGAAVPKDVWRRRFATLKEAGVNAIRIAHNPGSDEFITLCDEMGILVQDEFYDEWDNPKDKRKNMNEQHDDYISRGHAEHFQEHAEQDLKDVMRSHRNHPSIFQWSIGNEVEWTYPRNAEATGFFDADWSGNYFWEQPPHSREQIAELLETLPKEKYDIGETAQKLANWTREMDTSRPVIANCILPAASYQSGYADALDVIGFSYRRVMYDYGHAFRPDLPVMGTENLAQWHEWKAVLDRPFVAGTFLWTGIDYMGEVDGQWPKNTTDSGLLDRAGFEKVSFHMMKTLWSENPHIHLTTQTLEKSPYMYESSTGFIGEEDADAWQKKLWIWHDVNTHWNYDEDELIAVEVYSNCESVELFLNDESLGVKQLIDFEDRIYKWAVPFSSGTLEARASAGSDQLKTAGKPTAISLSKDGLHVIVQLADAAGEPVKTEEHEIVFEVSGARILGVDNGSPLSAQDYQSNRVLTSQGRCLLVLDSEAATIKVTAGELESSI